MLLSSVCVYVCGMCVQVYAYMYYKIPDSWPGKQS